MHGAADNEENAKARQYIRQCEAHFADFPRFNFLRELGSGGFGMALKFEQRDERDQRVRFLVLKIPTTEGPAIATFMTEFRWYTVSGRRPHGDRGGQREQLTKAKPPAAERRRAFRVLAPAERVSGRDEAMARGSPSAGERRVHAISAAELSVSRIPPSR